MRRFFTAATHRGDHHTINILCKPFANFADMDAHVVEHWNAMVAANDEVWHDGGFPRPAAGRSITAHEAE